MINSKAKIFLRKSETVLNPLTLHGAGNHMTKMALSNTFQSNNGIQVKHLYKCTIVHWTQLMKD